MIIRLNVERFNELQEAIGLSDTNLAKLMQINRSHIWRVKNRKHAPGESFIAAALNIFPSESFDNLFFMEEMSREGHNTGTDGS